MESLHLSSVEPKRPLNTTVKMFTLYFVGGKVYLDVARLTKYLATLLDYIYIMYGRNDSQTDELERSVFEAHASAEPVTGFRRR